MTEHTPLARTPRERFLEAARKEMVDFERREDEFRRKDKAERAADLRLPLTGPKFTQIEPVSRERRFA
jgi:hypothetical protein